MAFIKPFRGVRFDPRKVEISAVISQPYDRVRYGLQDRYYAQSPYNVVRIIKGREMPGDRPQGPNVYTRARRFYERWRAQEVLIRERRPALYLYRQTFTVGGREMTRQGLVAALRLSSFDEGIVLPHERTHSAPKQDRLQLLRALQVNMGQVFMLYPDPQNRINALLAGAVEGLAPIADATEAYERDVRQRLWVITDERVIKKVQEEMLPRRNLIIADGHHRYETALAYRAEMQARHPDASDDAWFNYRMVTLVSMDDPGLVIMPTHREVFGYPHLDDGAVLARLASTCRISPVADLETCLSAMHAQADEHAFGLYIAGRYYLLVLRATGEPADDPVRSLDVYIAHNLILPRALGKVVKSEHLRYHRDPRPALRHIDAGDGNLLLLLNPTRMSQVKACARYGLKMPPKSTDFYPKMVTGLVMMPLTDGR